MTRVELFELARRLTRDEQLKVAHDLWVGADGPSDDPAAVDAAWASEIRRRLEGIVDGSIEGVPGSQVRRRFGK